MITHVREAAPPEHFPPETPPNAYRVSLSEINQADQTRPCLGCVSESLKRVRRVFRQPFGRARESQNKPTLTPPVQGQG